MVKAGSGSVINIGSAAAQFGVTNGVIYAALKAAVVHYTRCLAAAVRTEGVRINAVSPGATKTARFEATRVVDPEKMDSSIKSLIRYGEPDEIADAVAFLAGPEKQVYQRPGSSGRRRRDAVSGLTNGQEQHNRRLKVSDAKRFEGMTAVVTGGASGIGLGVRKADRRRGRAGRRSGTRIPRG